MAEDSEDEEYSIPLAYPAPYGAGLKKKGVKFVSAGTLETSSSTIAQPREDIAASYLALVLGKASTTTTEPVARCQTCNLPLQDTAGVEHHTSLAHQVALTHIHPPNAVDRTRKGFAYLEAQGWDADSRRGLGAQGDGILKPIPAVEKKDKAGVGGGGRSSTPKGKNKVEKPRGLDPKALRKVEQQKAKKGKRLHDMFYTDDAVAKYLGEQA